MGFVLWDKIRLLMKRGNIYGHENLFQNQSQIDHVLKPGDDDINLTDPNFMLEQTNVQINRLERYKDYDQMDEVGEISLALDMYSDEASLRDPERNHSVFVKTGNARLKEEIEELLYDTLNIDAQIRPMTRYLCKYGDLSMEIIPTQNRDGISSIKTMESYNFTRVETKYGDLVGFFFQEEGGEPVYYHPWQVCHIRLASFEKVFSPYGKSLLDGARRDFRRLRLMEDAALVYRLCLRGDSKVWTPSGHTEIKDIKIGDEVYSYDCDGNLKIANVVYQKCNGKDQIFRVYSQHREVYTNASHPILVEERYKANGKWHNKFKYVDVKDLKTLKNHGSKEYCHRFLLPKHNNCGYVNLEIPEIPTHIKIANPVNVNSRLSYVGKKHGYKKSSLNKFFSGEHSIEKESALSVIDHTGVLCETEEIKCWSFDYTRNKANEYSIPDIADEEFAMWFGFMIGDGYISTGKYQHRVGFALGDKDDVNNKYKAIFEKYVGKLQFNDDDKRIGTYYVNSKYLHKFMIDNGFIAGAHNKRVPEWVFRSPPSVQEAFIDGYVDADGHCRVIKNCLSESIELDCCNKDLLDDIKELTSRLGWTSGLVRKHQRTGGHLIEENRMMPDTTAWSLYFKKTVLPVSERIIGVEKVGDDLVYDIGVDSEEHNFIVNGIPVHNSRAPEKRVFKVPVGNLPPKEREQYIQIIARRFKKHKFIDPSTGAMNERYAPHIQDDDYWVPMTSDGNGVEIQTLQGAENLDAIADIEYFKKKMVAALKIPFHRVGLGDPEGDPGKSIASQSPEFSKAVQWVQDQLIVGIKKIVLVHLALKEYPVEMLRDFELGMTSASAIDELYRIETWASRVDIMGGLKELGFFPDKWIAEHFTNLTEDELEFMQRTQEANAVDEPAEGEEEEVDFFENKYNNLTNKLKNKIINDRMQLIREKINSERKYGSHASFQKLLNENEFDGIDEEDYLNKDKNEAKLLVEKLLKEELDEIEPLEEDDED